MHEIRVGKDKIRELYEVVHQVSRSSRSESRGVCFFVDFTSLD